MINIRQAVRRGLREDGALTEVLGMDADGEQKVYTRPTKPNVTVPYVVVDLIPVPGVDGVYGDDEVLERFLIQLSVWADSDTAAWTIAPILDEAMKNLRLEVTPYEHNFTQRYQSAETLAELNSNLWQVVMRYDVRIAR